MLYHIYTSKQIIQIEATVLVHSTTQFIYLQLHVDYNGLETSELY